MASASSLIFNLAKSSTRFLSNYQCLAKATYSPSLFVRSSIASWSWRYYTTKSVPSDKYRFTKSHEWAALDGNIATVGISYYAQDKLGEAVYVDIPDVGTEFEQGDVFGTVESVKAAADLYAPVGGEVTEVNGELVETPSLVNEDPYDNGWIVKLKVKDDSEYSQLMSAEEYEEFLNEND